MDTVFVRWNGRDWPIERGILRPCLYKAAIEAYGRVQPNAWMIFPYEIVENGDGNARARLFQPDEMEARFPQCWAYLNARRNTLEGRDIGGGAAGEEQWYQYGRSQSLTKFDTPKIILPVLSVEPRYGYDEANTLFTTGGNGPYYMVRAANDLGISNLYLLAVLNHPFSEALIRTNTSPFRGGYYSHGKQFIEDLPVPVPAEPARQEIERLVSELITVLDELAAARIRREQVRRERAAIALRREIERRMNGIFGLSETDIEIVMSVPVPE